MPKCEWDSDLTGRRVELRLSSRLDMKNRNALKRSSMGLLLGLITMLSLTACKSTKADPNQSEHPTKEHPASEHPTSEHPTSNAPAKH